MRPSIGDAVSPALTRVLLALLAVYARDGRATVRDVRTEAGHRSTAHTHKMLVELARRGLVTWDAGKDGTLRPLVWPTKNQLV